VGSVFVLDTHSLIFYAAGQLSKLGKEARKLFSRFEEGQVFFYVPAPVAVELWMLVNNGRVGIKTSFRAWWAEIIRPQLLATELSMEDVLAASELDWAHSDIFDRLIVATALRLGCPLVTRDAAITDWGGVDVIW
jgi:PIN domain nuclease of toxin-antitoxin system